MIHYTCDPGIKLWFEKCKYVAWQLTNSVLSSAYFAFCTNIEDCPIINGLRCYLKRFNFGDRSFHWTEMTEMP